jgi:hypothetical protein
MNNHVKDTGSGEPLDKKAKIKNKNHPYALHCEKKCCLMSK